ncbi:MAG: glycosyltransferase [Fibrobacter sp.]|nr:glycosyltransferase [Fibrobacter sp.]
MPKMLTIEIADPFGVGGGCYATHAHIRAFSELFNGQVDVCVPANSNKADSNLSIANLYRVGERSLFSKICSVFSGDLHRYTKFVKKLIEKNDYEWCVCDGSISCSSLYRSLKKANIKIISIHHNHEPEYFRDNTTNFMYKWFWLPYVKKAERKAYLNSDINIFLTKQDEKTFRNVYGPTKAFNAVLGTFESSFNHDQIEINHDYENEKKDSLVFVITGSLCNYQTIDGIVYFFENLYQFLPKQSRVVVAGRSPAEKLLVFLKKYKNVEIVANPRNIESVVAQADVYVCPTRIGGGLKLRVMDGLRCGKAVITHTCSARGYDAFENKNYFFVYKNPEEFRNCLLRYEKNKANFLKEGIIADYQKIFSYEAGKKRMEEIMNRYVQMSSDSNKDESA